MGGDLIPEARRRAALTQRELAERVGTSQPVIARWESGHVDPGFETLRRVVRHAGFNLLVGLRPYDAADLAQAKEMLKLSPAQRIGWRVRPPFVAELRAPHEFARG